MPDAGREATPGLAPQPNRSVPGTAANLTEGGPASGEHGASTSGRKATVPVEELLRLADRIEREHAVDFCACCTTDAQHLRSLAARYSATAPARETTT